MSVNIYDKDNDRLICTASGASIWTGTKNSFNEQKQAGTLPLNAVCIITDDEEAMDTVPTEDSPVAVTSDGLYNTFLKRTFYSDSITLPDGWIKDTNSFVCYKQGQLMFVYGNMYTTGAGISNNGRLVCENFFPSDCYPSYQTAYVLGASDSKGNSLKGSVTAYSPGGRTLYIDNSTGNSVKQIYFNIIHKCYQS